MTFSGRCRYRYFGNVLADTYIDNRYINLLATKLCHYFSTKLTRKASLIPIQRKTIANTSHSQYYSMKKQTKNTTIWQSLSRALVLALKNKQFKVIILSRYFIGGKHRYDISA